MIKKSDNISQIINFTPLINVGVLSAYTVAIVFGVALPFILIPLIALTGYSEIFEELAKAVVIFFIVLQKPKSPHIFFSALLFGFLFSISESFLYATSLSAGGAVPLFVSRLLLTMPMHVVTSAIIAGAIRLNIYAGIAGLAVATILHVIFNAIVAA